MSPGVVLFIIMLALAFVGFPIYVALGVSVVVALQMAGLPFITVPQKVFNGINSTALLAIPFFMLAGNLMAKGITNKLVNIANALLGHVKGSLAVITVAASALFGAITGSAVATCSAIGGLTVPAMKKEGYPAPFAAAITSMSAILGPLVPPSIPLIVFACLTETSVASLFKATVIPAILFAIYLICYALWYGKKHDFPAHEKATPKEVGHAFKDGIWALLMPVIILGGIFGGVFTATEAAVVSAAYALIVGLFVYKELHLSDLVPAFVEASISTATILLLIGMSNASSYIVVATNLPKAILTAITSLTSSKFLILLMINLLLLVVGCLIECNAAEVMIVPLMLPLMKALDVSMLQFGMIFCFNMYLGLITPPVGTVMLLGKQISGTTVSETIKGCIPMFLVGLILLALITYVPALTTWLPGLG
jgi:tripartite ATP-independent transporter DctM subunit